MNKVFLSLGGNKGDKIKYLEQAISMIEKRVGNIIEKSRIYTTAAWGNTKQPDFLNQVVCINTKLESKPLLNALIVIEKELGRNRTGEKWEQRTMDIDILFFNQEVINERDLIIPHPHISSRKFVLIPMSDIASSFVHPALCQDIKTLLALCNDSLSVDLYAA